MTVRQIPFEEAPQPQKRARSQKRVRGRSGRPIPFGTLVRQRIEAHPEVAEGTPDEQYQAIRDELMLRIWEYVPSLLASYTKYAIRKQNIDRRGRGRRGAREVAAHTGGAVFAHDQLGMPVLVPREGIKPIGQLRGREFFRVARSLAPAAASYQAYVGQMQKIADVLHDSPDMTLEQAIDVGLVSAKDFAAWVGNIRTFKLPEQEENKEAATS